MIIQRSDVANRKDIRNSGYGEIRCARCTEMELAGASRSPTQARFLKACRTHKAQKAVQFTAPQPVRSSRYRRAPRRHSQDRRHWKGRRVANRERETGRHVSSRRRGGGGDLHALQHQQIKAREFAPSLFRRSASRLDDQDRFGNPVVPHEWFLAPVSAIDEVVQRIQDHSIRV
jgi:hypothetical protein